MNAISDTELFDRLGHADRMHQLARFNIFDPGLRDRLNAVAAGSAERLHAPLSLVSVLLDTAQFIIGQHGMTGQTAETRGGPAEWTLCAHTVLAGEPYCVTDAPTDPRHAGNPMITHAGVGSYAGVPLIDESGQVLGAHCVVDMTPRTFTGGDIAALTEAAGEAIRILGDYRTG